MVNGGLTTFSGKVCDGEAELSRAVPFTMIAFATSYNATVVLVAPAVFCSVARNLTVRLSGPIEGGYCVGSKVRADVKNGDSKL